MLLAVCFGIGDHTTRIAIIDGVLHILQIGLVGVVCVRSSVAAGLPAVLLVVHLGLGVSNCELAVVVLWTVHWNGVVVLHGLHSLHLVALGLVLHIFTQV